MHTIAKALIPTHLVGTAHLLHRMHLLCLCIGHIHTPYYLQPPPEYLHEIFQWLLFRKPLLYSDHNGGALGPMARQKVTRCVRAGQLWSATPATRDRCGDNTTGVVALPQPSRACIPSAAAGSGPCDGFIQSSPRLIYVANTVSEDNTRRWACPRLSVM